MANLGDMIRQNLETVRSTAQRVRTRARVRAEGLLPMPSSNPGGGVLQRLRSGGSGGAIGGGGVGGGIMERVQAARQRLLGGTAPSVLGGGKVKEVGPTTSTKTGKVRTL